MENNNKVKIKIDIAGLKKDIDWIKKELRDIKENHFPHFLDAIKDNSDKIDSIKDRLFVGFMITVVSLLIMQVLLKFFD